MRLLEGMGYRRVRHLADGMSGWKAAGGGVESGSPGASGRATGRSPVPRGMAGRAMARWSDRVVDFAGRASFGALLGSWAVMVLAFAVSYWLLDAVAPGGLRDRGIADAADLPGFLSAVYFSFVTATSVGFGDVLPSGLARALALVEACAALLLFGAVVSKLVSRRQELLIEEIHRIAFEDRLGRVRQNLHLVLAELQNLGTSEAAGLSDDRYLQRVESAAIVFAGELRAVHDLLYRPQQEPEEEVLEGILASLAAGLLEFQSVFSRCSRGRASPVLRGSVETMRRLAGEICGDCVPRSYAEGLRTWMNRVQSTANALGAGSTPEGRG